MIRIKSVTNLTQFMKTGKNAKDYVKCYRILLTNAISWAFSKWKISVWLDVLLIFVREALRVELVGVGEVVRVKVETSNWD
jgi:hypothetical protein